MHPDFLYGICISILRFPFTLRIDREEPQEGWAVGLARHSGRELLYETAVSRGQAGFLPLAPKRPVWPRLVQMCFSGLLQDAVNAPLLSHADASGPSPGPAQPPPGFCAAAPAVPSLPLNGFPQGAQSAHKWAPIKACLGGRMGDPGGLQLSTPAHRSYKSMSPTQQLPGLHVCLGV